MISLYLLLGLVTAALGAAPLGAVNIAVINTTIKENTTKALYIAAAAGIGEVLLAFFALHCSMELSSFFTENRWIQILFVVFFLGIGIYFLVKKTSNKKTTKIFKLKVAKSKFFTGFSLAILNPPVIIYWIIAISLTNKHFFRLDTKISFIAITLFFLGIYFGKIGILYLYSQWGNKMVQKSGDSKQKLSKIIGTALIVLSIFQGIKLLV